ncbi:MAG TPA: SLBB domain-containing protein, partial [Bacillota bacterium]|nr:SLBB domain-containing protein [Bacillota bacterium]
MSKVGTRTIDADRIEAAGIVGAGGAGFPTHIKARGAADTVIANGVECEPVLGKDKAIMRAHPDDVVAGLVVMMGCVGAPRGVIAVKRKNSREVDSMRGAARGHANVTVAEVGDYYPAGDEHVLVYEVTGRVVPAGGIPLQVGAVVSNVETLLNVAKAVRDNVPVTRKYVTVAGEVKRPGTFRVPVGTSLAQLVEAAGGVRESLRGGFEVLLDGPMMGKALPLGQDLSAAQVTKTMSGAIVLPSGHPLLAGRKQSMEHQVRLARSACVQCTHCTDMCPRSLLGHPLRPHLIMRNLGYMRPKLPQDLERYPELMTATLCSECGVCNLVCPMGLTPGHINAGIKRAMAEARLKWKG